MKIPLSHFVDRSNPMVPVGLLVPTGLTSAMRNPLYGNYTNQITLDYRPRDNANFSTARTTYGLKTTMVQNEVWHPQCHLSTDGLNVSSVYPINALLPPTDIDRWSFTVNHNVVIVVAYKISSLVPVYTGGQEVNSLIGPSDPDGFTSYLMRVSGGGHRIWHWNKYASHYVVGNAEDVYTTNSLNKWLVFFLSKRHDAASRTHVICQNVAGGQFGSTPLGSSFTIADSNSLGSCSKLYVGAHPHLTLGFQSVAIYLGNNDAGVNGTDPTDIDWSIFDSEHVCNHYDVSGSTISFSNEGEVAFEIYHNGNWVNTDGSSGAENRQFYSAGYNVLNCPSFTAIRPVLRNTGTLNADVQAKLLWVDVEPGSKSRAIPVSSYQAVTDLFGSAQDKLTGIADYYLYAAEEVLLSHSYDVELDLLAPLYNAYLGASQLYSSPPASIVGATRTLQAHVLSRARTAIGMRFTDINDWIDAGDKNGELAGGTGGGEMVVGRQGDSSCSFTVSPKFAALSSSAGFDIAPGNVDPT